MGYLLTNCKSGSTIYTESNLTVYVNSVITVEEYPTMCFSVSIATDVDPISVTLVKGYDDCECCLPPVPIKYTRIEPAPNRVFYKVPSQCDISANVKFANAYYRLFKNLRYGINDQCDTIDINKITIKKELSDYAAIYDATACVNAAPTTPNVCCNLR
jgi:hypothetical protein